MNKRLAFFLILVVLLIVNLACDGSGGVAGVSSLDSTATAAAGEFHLQLTLVASQATPVAHSTPLASP